MLNIRKNKGKQEVKCLVRNKWLLLTPEEWVRQQFLSYLINTFKISPLRIGVEVLLKVNSINKRADIVVWNKELKPLWIIECKEENVQLSDDVLHQVLTYYSVIKTKYISITNGYEILTWKIVNGKMENVNIIENIQLD